MIHDTAIIDPNAKIGKNVEIGPFCIIGPNVKIGDNNKLQSNVVLIGNTTVDEGNVFYPFSSIGNDPQDLKYKGENTELIIGKNNKIREYVTIHPGTIGGGGKTIIGSNNLLMISVHIAHDCIIGNNIVLANNVAVAGHAEISDNVIIGGNSGVQQFTRIGKMAMVGGMTGVDSDVIPYGLCIGNRNILQGLNLVGLRRNNISNKDIIELGKVYDEIFKSKQIRENLSKLNGSFDNNQLVMDVINFLNKDKKRPICSPFIK